MLPGSGTSLTDTRAKVVQEFVFDSFGNLRGGGAGRIKQPYSFTGREYDRETRLYYYRARYYDPEVGRFMGRDAIGSLPIKPWSLNRYAYVYNNSVNATDPSGNYAIVDDLIVSGIGLAGGLVGQYASDVIANTVDGSTGFGVLKPRSSWKVYVVSGVGGAITAEAAWYLGPPGAFVAAGATNVVRSKVAGEEIILSDALIEGVVAGVTTGVIQSFPKVPGRWPNLFTRNFFTGRHTQRIILEQLMQEGTQINRELALRTLDMVKISVPAPLFGLPK